MRWLLVLVVLVACSSPSRRADPIGNTSRDGGTGDASAPKLAVGEPFTLEVMPLEVVVSNGVIDPAVTRRAHELTPALRAAAREFSGVAVVSSGKQLLDLKLLFNCESEAPTCMAAITRSLPADRMIWGTLEGDRLKLHHINAANEVVIHWVNEGAPIDEVGIDKISRDAIRGLLTRAP